MAGGAAPRPWFALQCTHREKADKKPLKDINVEMSSTSAPAAIINGSRSSRSVPERERKNPGGSLNYTTPVTKGEI